MVGTCPSCMELTFVGDASESVSSLPVDISIISWPSEVLSAVDIYSGTPEGSSRNAGGRALSNGWR